jgi:hypothetical protein
MAKPKFPKKNKNSDAQEIISSSNEIKAAADNGTTAAELAAASLTETQKTETENKTTPKRTVRKPEIVKSEPRTNLVPINMEDEIRRLAYLMSERRGFEAGHETEDWLAAEREIRQRYRQQTA